jgi:SagB-type dehydrogenase family enzyme
MHRLVQDLDFSISAGLLIAALATILTGVISDLWDLNEFWYHTLAGYVMTGFAIAHVALNWGRLTAYARFRVRITRQWLARRRGRLAPSAGTSRARRDAVVAVPTGDPRWVRIMLSRRGLLGLGVGALAGLALGRGLRVPPPIAKGSDVGVIYHEWSKPGLVDALGTLAHWGATVDLYKAYPGAARVALPSVGDQALDAGPVAARVIAGRHSTRDFAAAPMSLDELSSLLFLTGGITRGLHGNARRAAPSSGALYPIEVYAVVHRVDGVEPGVYHYAVREHALELVRAGDHRARVVDQALGQDFLGECGVVLFLTQILQRMRPKYQDRSYRYGLLEAGHLGENAYLAATAMGLGACGVGAFMDDAINEMLGVDGVDEAALYMLAVGKVAA